jgi:hypothetical protein
MTSPGTRQTFPVTALAFRRCAVIQAHNFPGTDLLGSTTVSTDNDPLGLPAPMATDATGGNGYPSGGERGRSEQHGSEPPVAVTRSGSRSAGRRCGTHNLVWARSRCAVQTSLANPRSRRVAWPGPAQDGVRAETRLTPLPISRESSSFQPCGPPYGCQCATAPNRLATLAQLVSG